LVLATFAMKDMRRLRAMAVLSNLAFIVYGAINGLLPVLILHLLLFPLNLRRLIEETRVLPSARRTPSKATLLAIEALQYAGAARPEAQSQPARPTAPEPRTRSLAQQRRQRIVPTLRMPPAARIRKQKRPAARPDRPTPRVGSPLSLWTMTVLRQLTPPR
jgi:hypothetical protein